MIPFETIAGVFYEGRGMSLALNHDDHGTIGIFVQRNDAVPRCPEDWIDTDLFLQSSAFPDEEKLKLQQKLDVWYAGRK